MQLLPKEIVEFLDEYVIGQKNAKKVIAIALRNRYRRMQLEKAMQDDIMPKNILMIGSTGVGKTEIARRIAKSFALPFVKVEASKYTQVGYVGRDVESMVRDLANAALQLVKKEHLEKSKEKLNELIEKEILAKLLPPLPKTISDEKKLEYEASLEKMKERLRKGEFDDKKIEIKVTQHSIENATPDIPQLAGMQEMIKVIGFADKKVKKEVSIKDARKMLENELIDQVLDNESIKDEALRRVQNEGIIFIDEIDKVAVSSSQSKQDPSKEGVQRDLLPIVEGSEVKTSIGLVKTDHILFIAAGAFHFAKPSDLIPELQGRFPLRVELESLGADELYAVLTKPKNSLLKQYTALLETEGVSIKFSDEAIKKIAELAASANEEMEDIGARRLHTVIEKILQDISYDFSDYVGKEYLIDEAKVSDELSDIIKNQDLARYIL